MNCVTHGCLGGNTHESREDKMTHGCLGGINTAPHLFTDSNGIVLQSQATDRGCSLDLLPTGTDDGYANYERHTLAICNHENDTRWSKCSV